MEKNSQKCELTSLGLKMYRCIHRIFIQKPKILNLVCIKPENKIFQSVFIQQFIIKILCIMPSAVVL